MGTFHLRVRRDIEGPAHAAVAAAPVMAAPAAPVAAVTVPAYISVDAEPEESIDEGMVYVITPKVSGTAPGRLQALACALTVAACAVTSYSAVNHMHHLCSSPLTSCLLLRMLHTLHDPTVHILMHLYALLYSSSASAKLVCFVPAVMLPSRAPTCLLYSFLHS